MAWLLLTAVLAAQPPLEKPAAGGLASLRIFQDGYPRAFFFRSPENLARHRTVAYEEWSQCFSRLMGIEGKVLDEERMNMSERNIAAFTRFKKEHPDQLVLLHFCADGRDPDFGGERYFSGHWLHGQGSRILGDVPAEEGETDVPIEGSAFFSASTGEQRLSQRDIALCPVDTQGKPDWKQSEQVQLVSVDVAKRSVRVRRGCYGSRPRAFAGGLAFAMAHVVQDVTQNQSTNVMWRYNYSTRCPRDAQGRTCGEALADELALSFGPGGPLSSFDGVAIDGLGHEAGAVEGRSPDCDADGKSDGGVFEGVNTYGLGVIDFCRRLRDKLGPEKLIVASGGSVGGQRAFGILNGMECQGWPGREDWQVRDWSGGLNRLRFWQQSVRPPAFNYVAHPFRLSGTEEEAPDRTVVPFSTHRLVFAAAVCSDAAIGSPWAPKQKEPFPAGIGVWDEFRQALAGTDRERPAVRPGIASPSAKLKAQTGRDGIGVDPNVQTGWLGKPLGAMVRLAERAPDVLAGQGAPPKAGLLKRLSSDNAALTLKDDRLVVRAVDPRSGNLRFRLREVPCKGPDLFVQVTASGEALPGYPSEMARWMWLGIAGAGADCMKDEIPTMGMCLRGGTEVPLDEQLGAVFAKRSNVNILDEVHVAYTVHPPIKRPGYTFWQCDVEVPRGGQLKFFTGKSKVFRGESDGVVFSIIVTDRRGLPANPRPVFQYAQIAHVWKAHSVSLAAWGGRSARLKFIVDCGPRNHTTRDGAFWGDVAVVGPEYGESTEPIQFMSWLGEQDFTSGFYFSDIKSKTVDVDCTIEGASTLNISSIKAYHCPDVLVRDFEHGLVVANPSPRPYTLDLPRWLHGRRLRRIQGTVLQDPTANNGAALEDKLLLQPKEGLFLLRQ